MARQRIAILISDLGGGGAQRQALFLADEWVRRGHGVSILTYEAPGTPSFFTVPDNVLVRRLDGIRSSNNAMAGVRRNIQRIFSMRAALRELDVDILFAFMAEMSVTALLAAKPLGIPVIACERSNPAIHPSSKMWRLMRDLAYPRCTRIICQTRSAADYFAYTGKSTVIPNIINAPDVSGSADKEAPPRDFIAALGRLGPEKGYDILIRAFARIASSRPDIDLMIVGEGGERQALQALAEELGVGPRLYMPGAAKQPFPLIRTARAFVMSSRFEGFPNALAEAMALGIPCVATRFSGVEDIIRDGENGRLVALEDVEAMAAALADLLDHPDRAAALGREAMRVASDFSAERVMTLWDQALKV